MLAIVIDTFCVKGASGPTSNSVAMVEGLVY
jgi:hypothetical protein